MLCKRLGIRMPDYCEIRGGAEELLRLVVRFIIPGICL